jgi:hypothetical protein
VARGRHLAKALSGVKAGTVLDAYTERYGVRKGAVRAAHFAQMVIVAVDLGDDWTAPQYADYWSVDERTVFNHRAEAVEVYGENWRQAVSNVAAVVRKRNVRSPGGIVRLPIAI